MIILCIILMAAAGATAFKPMSIAEFKARPIPEFAKQLTGQALVDYINKAQPFFRANHSTMPYEQFKARLMDLKYIEVEPLARAEPIRTEEEIPESFDARKKWPNCASIKLVRDQANCGSCWAVAAASTMSDRLCIASEQKTQKLLSDTDILACCDNCGFGCNGGYSFIAWQYIISHGVCSGGPYDTRNVCKPYAFHPCGHHKDQPYYGECLRSNEDTPICRERCSFGYKKTYEEDKVYGADGKSAYYVGNSEEAIQKEIMTNGPVHAGFTVYTDFSKYSGGVYVHTAGKQEGGHAIKIIGWGVEKGEKYWLVANSWNSDWGEDGYFRILRGSDECGIESRVIGGLLKV